MVKENSDIPTGSSLLDEKIPEMSKTVTHAPSTGFHEEKLIDQMISDVFMITADPKAANQHLSGSTGKTFLYEFCNGGQRFSLDQIDLILMQRLAKDVKRNGKDENKFMYLYESYCKIAEHLVARRKSMAGKVKEL